MPCRLRQITRYARPSSPFANISTPFVYVLFSDCLARKAHALDPEMRVFKLGFSAGTQDRFRSLIDGWKYKGGFTPPLGNCRSWESIGTWKMKSAKAFERKFIGIAKERMRVLPSHVYLEGVKGLRLSERSNGESEIYWFNDKDFEDSLLYEERVRTEEPGSREAFRAIFAAIEARQTAFLAKQPSLPSVCSG
ncbi:hypothetical protein [Agrobacterium tumefaciens]|uniref:hypothetical protein n=1 Tax=Agrobacterium tumefaciens TaxID=358 RepID=UPI0015732F9C|nr:hypothetical protein [Agrobacterium tumefaciens]